VNLSGKAELPAPPQDVWALLTDPARLAPLLPGCERLEPDGPDRYKAVVKFALAAISGQYAGSLELREKRPTHSLVLKLSGKGLPGFVNGEGRIELAPGGAGTMVRYSGEAQVGGVIASVGQRLLEAAARKIVQQFFDSAAAKLRSAEPSAQAASPPAPHAGRRKSQRKGK
jgi:uncharacterized protein